MQRETVDAVLNFYGDKSSQWLSDLTHMEPPWREARARAGLADGRRGSAIIKRADIAEYYGGLLPWWDWCFGTYCAQPRDGHDAMTLGIEDFREPRDSWFHRILVLPFLSQGTDSRGG